MERSELEKILNGPGYFFCEQFKTRMSKKVCVDRQNREPNFGNINDYVPESFEGCKDCGQGRKITASGPEGPTPRRENIGERSVPRGGTRGAPHSGLRIKNKLDSGLRRNDKREEDKMTTKICKKCGQPKDLEKDFNRHPSTTDGYEGACKKCKSDQRKERLKDKQPQPAKKVKRIKVVRQPESGGNKKSDKPPLGLRPRKIAIEERMEEVQEAIERYMNGKVSVPIEWLSEYNDLADALLSGRIILNAGS